jgi:hypothetical protein
VKIGAPYIGYAPPNIKRDAKYTVKRDEGGQWAVQVRYDEGNGWEYLLWSHAHPVLVQRVNAIKLTLNGREGGIFYINEIGHVLVPDPPGPHRYAGTNDQFVEFDYGADVIGPVPADDLAPGDPWLGPHVGVAYTLADGAKDIYFWLKDPTDRNRRQKVQLSAHVGSARAAALCAPYPDVKGHKGGRIYINEAGTLFTPVLSGGAWEYLYLGSVEIGKDDWFPNPLGG